MTQQLKEFMTTDEIMDALSSCTTLPAEFKAEVLAMISATLQAAYNSMTDPSLMQPGNTHGDWWQEQYNRVAEVYQRYVN